jgi:hypothetical protein
MPVQPKSRRARMLRALLYIVGLPAVVVICFYAEEDARGKGDWNAFKQKWEAKGENFDRASFIPAAVPDNKNFALTPIVYSTYGYILTRDGKVIPEDKRDRNFVDGLKLEWDWLEAEHQPTNGIGDWTKGTLSDLKPWQAYYRDLAAKTNLFPVPSESKTPAKDVLLAISIYDDPIEELRQASLLPYSRFPLTYDAENPEEIYLPHLARLKRCSTFLQFRSIAELQNAESQKSLEDIKLSLRLAAVIRSEPFLISHLVRVAMAETALQPVYEGLAHHQWSDAQLAELHSELAKFDFVVDYQFNMRAETVFLQQGLFNYLRHNQDRLLDLKLGTLDYDPIPHFHWVKKCGRLIPSGWLYQNQTRCADMTFQYFVPIADTNRQTISPSLADAASAAFAAETQNLTPYTVLERILARPLDGAARRFAHAQGSLNLAQTAIELEQFRLATGNYPESLDDLKSQHLRVPPNDVINGLPLHYSHTNETFLLYSVGWNETDDGGKIGVKRHQPTPDPALGDWVWKYPTL